MKTGVTTDKPGLHSRSSLFDYFNTVSWEKIQEPQYAPLVNISNWLTLKPPLKHPILSKFLLIS